MREKFIRLIAVEDGQGTTEYGLVLGVIAVGVLGIVIGLKQEVYQIYDRSARLIEQAARNAGLLP